MDIISMNLTILSEDDYKSLDVLKKYGTKAAITDLAIITGGYTYGINESTYEYVPDDKSLKGRSGICFVKSSDSESYQGITYIDSSGKFIENGENDYYFKNAAIRPVIQSSEIFYQFIQDKVIGYEGIYEVEFCEYPQYVADENIQEEFVKNKKRIN